MLIFVLKLDTDDWSSVPEHKALKLSADFVIQAADIIEIAFIVRADFEGPTVEPVRQATVADFTMTKRADSHDSPNVVLGTKLDEAPQVPVAGPIENALLFFVQTPENVGGDNVHAAPLAL